MSGRVPTPEQAAAIAAAGRDVLVEAGAGTGKTGTMVDRYCRLVCEEGVSPDAVLAFTFTDKAAAELRERIRAALELRTEAGSERARELLPGLGGAWVTTIHGFCNRLLSAHPVTVGIDPRFRVLDAAEAERAAREAFDEALEAFLAGGDEERERTVAAFDVAGLRAMVCGAHAELRSRGVATPRLPPPPAPTDAMVEAGAAEEGEAAYRHVRELLELFGERFAAAKERRAGVDFEDLQLLAVRLLERSEAGAAYRSRFSHLMVDEFQDTNRLQLRLIEALRGPGSQLMVVGDELQSIYGFRHADLDVFRERRGAIEASPDGEAIPLSGNFRARPELIGAVNAIGESLLGEAFRPLRVGAAAQRPGPRGEGPAAELLLTRHEGWDGEGIDLEPAIDARTPLPYLAEARFVAARLRELADAGVSRGEMVVLLRAFTHLDAYEDSLERAGLRPYVVGGRGYWSQQQVADVCALLATIANPLDDRALFGALASPACGAAPDTLWLLRAAAGRGRPIWRSVEWMTGSDAPEPAEPGWLERISEPERELLRRFAATIGELRGRSPFLPLAALIDAVVTETGYDLAVLMRPAGEARFANVRKLMRLAADFEAAEGRDLRGLLDFLAARAGADADPQAATAVEGHDGVRIMTVHSAKGLEFDVVAVPHLSRGLLSPARAPLLTIGHEAEGPRVGMQLRRLGAPTVKLYAHEELCGEAQEREAEEELRLFHVAATRARERLILSGVVKAEPPRGAKAGTPVVERIVATFGIDRERDTTVPIPAPQAREGLDATFGSSQLAVRVNRASPVRAAELAAVRKEETAAMDLGEGPAPLLAARASATPSRPLSYTAIAAQSPERGRGFDPIGNENSTTGGIGTEVGVAVHSLLEWSAGNGWREPPPELARRFALAAGLSLDTGDPAAEPVGFVQAWLASSLFRDHVQPARRCRAEVPLLLSLGGTVLRGSIDLLVEHDGHPPLIVDYKTDRLDGADPAERAERYEVQRDIYSLAASEALRAAEVEVAYVFLERPEQPVVKTIGPAELDTARRRLEARIEAIARTPAPP